jgi:hypothetical protein
MTELPTIKDESEAEEKESSSPTNARSQRATDTSSAASAAKSTKTKSPPSTSSPVAELTSPQSSGTSEPQSREDTPASSSRTTPNSADMQARQAKIKSLKPDLQKYLQFQQSYMTYYHYFYKLDPSDFVHIELIDLALSFEPLLYAVVGFAAYHHELQQERPKLSHFLGYHSKSLSMLRKSLEKNAKITEAVLLTVLQLAIFEEYLGDWVNLVGHHRAALTMTRDMYTPETIQHTEAGRRIFSWVARLDVMVGLMGGGETSLDRPWFESNEAYYHSQVDNDPESDLDVENMLAYFVAANRLIGTDLAAMFARFAKGEIGIETFHHENSAINGRVSRMKQQIQALNDDYYRVYEFPVAKSHPLNAEDIVNPYVPGGLFKDAFWPMNFMWVDWYSMELLMKYQTAVMLRQPMPPELERISLEQCRIYEAIERYPEAPAGSVLAAHAPLGLATVFLKKDPRHIMWARKKFAAVEKQGYIFPPSFRKRMAQMWGLTREAVGENETIENWWLPNDEGNTAMLKDLRKYVNERHESDMNLGKDSVNNVRDLKAIFEKLDLRTQSIVKSAGADDFSPISEVNSGLNKDKSPFTDFSPTNVSFGETPVHSSAKETKAQKRKSTGRAPTP